MLGELLVDRLGSGRLVGARLLHRRRRILFEVASFILLAVKFALRAVSSGVRLQKELFTLFIRGSLPDARKSLSGFEVVCACAIVWSVMVSVLVAGGGSGYEP